MAKRKMTNADRIMTAIAKSDAREATPPASYVWSALCSIAYWNQGGLKTRFEIKEHGYFDGAYMPGQYWTVSVRA